MDTSSKLVRDDGYYITRKVNIQELCVILEEINEYLNSESEGKEFKEYDEAYDDYIEAQVEETSSLEGYEFTQD